MKFRSFKVLIVCWLYLSVMNSVVYGQAWVKSMFEESTHDFGNVPRGAHVEHEFVLSNKYQENLHIAQVKSSCGCTIPRIEKPDLKTYEKGAIICEFNTRSFIGAKSAVVTVVFNAPYYGEMQLMVKGKILSDIVTDPGEIQFGELDRGTEKSTTVKVTYTGNKKWEITDVRSTNQHLGVRLNKVEKQGPVEYEMVVRLKDTAPAGDFSDQIVLVTNDSEYNLVTVPVRGNVLPPLVMPASVELGTFKSGESRDSRIVIKSNQDFEVTEVECSDQRFTFTPTLGKPAKVHLIPVVFKAGDVGAFRETVTVHTTLPEGGTASTLISGNVIP
ncbi:MAG: DUF1573 domain-containing protein [Aureliella sp.]